MMVRCVQHDVSIFVIRMYCLDQQQLGTSVMRLEGRMQLS